MTTSLNDLELMLGHVDYAKDCYKRVLIDANAARTILWHSDNKRRRINDPCNYVKSL